MVTVHELDKDPIEFASNELAIAYLKEHKLQNYSIFNGSESFTFFGGELLMAETSQIFKLGNVLVLKK